MARSGHISFGSGKLSKALKQYGEGIENEMKYIITQTAYLIQANAKSLAAFDDGNLKDSIEVEFKNGGLTAIVRVTASYAVYVEFGTGIYAVEGNGRKTPWTYYSNKLGRFVTTEGMQPQPFWFPAIKVGQKYFKKETRKLGL
ncbi:HK97-gp10 family putative phage morphogenesis protein [Paenisporosarcina sp. OV554]|uniref:HK97-gp10 family putative phage morphogenesis protein n=1 Tax=Paenisporosarcina sp. OV554 TaxID=2135694 RepID=UPI000D3348A8|nr:HK97-gp10 family putative phage morphogenesis protein [Paenisporosarcina sp. OV554]PUB12624.1 HK97 gp10 family phage protein [Paenisporosarcina sp. OV554]